LKAEENETLERLALEGAKLRKAGELQHTYEVVEAKKPVTRTESFREGLCYVQDKASCFAVDATNPQPGMMVLDICAAPGAKTTHLAQLMQNQGTILSLDYSERRMKVWKREIARMGVRIAEPIIADTRTMTSFASPADIVIIDPPCTSTGTFGKSPSAKWRLTPQSIDKMAAIQWQMLNSSAEQVKTRGSLVYSTCSITVEENEILIERFLKWHPEFSLTEIRPKLGLPGLRGLQKCRRLYPHVHRCNGFFVARFLKG
jgi:16S rRNA (cytosine967-C5)-methyltransferase